MSSSKKDIYATPTDSPVVPNFFDVRVQHKYLSRGVITREELDKHLKSLSDDKDYGVEVGFDTLVNEESSEPSGSESVEAGSNAH